MTKPSETEVVPAESEQKPVYAGEAIYCAECDDEVTTGLADYCSERIAAASKAKPVNAGDEVPEGHWPRIEAYCRALGPRAEDADEPVVNAGESLPLSSLSADQRQYIKGLIERVERPIDPCLAIGGPQAKPVNAGDRCIVCALKPRRGAVGLCTGCGASYDAHVETDDGTIASVIVWAANRARECAQPPAASPVDGTLTVDQVMAVVETRFANGDENWARAADLLVAEVRRLREENARLRGGA